VQYANGDPGRWGIEVWEDAGNNWVRTRRIWNQHAYSVTNVTENGQIPRRPSRNWLSPELNSFRQNTQPTGLFDAPDLVVREITRVDCDDRHFVLALVVGNEGSLSVPPGILTHVTVTSNDGRGFDLGAVPTTGWLRTGQSETLEVVFEIPQGPHVTGIVVRASVDDDGTGAQQYNECDDENNTTVSNPISCPSVQ